MPATSGSRPAMARSRVDFPDPTTAPAGRPRCPGARPRDTPSTATVVAVAHDGVSNLEPSYHVATSFGRTRSASAMVIPANTARSTEAASASP